ncbi:hypothetical protein Pfo_023316 [Paulownia fortunei]|nr:hypothetical protein Pfo_023316 [Paulownia fortunei]
MNGCTGKVGRAVLSRHLCWTSPCSCSFMLSRRFRENRGCWWKTDLKCKVPFEEKMLCLLCLMNIPNLIVVDYTQCQEWCTLLQSWSTFCIGNHWRDRELLYKTVADLKAYAVISPQMYKQTCIR